jgi:hypothetical protein
MVFSQGLVENIRVGGAVFGISAGRINCWKSTTILSNSGDRLQPFIHPLQGIFRCFMPFIKREDNSLRAFQSGMRLVSFGGAAKRDE